MERERERERERQTDRQTETEIEREIKKYLNFIIILYFIRLNYSHLDIKVSRKIQNF